MYSIMSDSRSAICDIKGSIELSFELKKVQETGGFVQFKGLQGVAVTSQLHLQVFGGYPIKDKNNLIAEHCNCRCSNFSNEE